MFQAATPLLLALAGAAAPAQEAQDTDRKAKRAQDQRAQDVPEIFEIGKPIDFSIVLQDVEGEEHRFADLRGKTIVLDFWSIRCPWSRKAEPKLKALHERFAGDDVVFLAIDSNEPEITDGQEDGYREIRDWLEEQGVGYPVLLDPGNVVADRFEAKTTPHVYVIDSKGILRYDGGIDDDPKETKGDEAETWAADAIAAVRAGRKPEKEKTQPFGCTIKRTQKRTADG